MSKGNSKNIPSINDVDSEVLEKTLFKDVLILRNKKTGILNIAGKVLFKKQKYYFNDQ